MKISKQSRRDAKTLFRACLVNGVLDGNRVRQTVEDVLSAKPRGYIALLDHFKRLVKLEEARRTATIESATVLPPEMQASFRSSLERRYGAGLHFNFQQNPALLGGVRVQVGSDVYDGSLRARLDDLAETF